MYTNFNKRKSYTTYTYLYLKKIGKNHEVKQNQDLS